MYLEDSAVQQACPSWLQDVVYIKQTVEAVKAILGKLVRDDKRPPKPETMSSDTVISVNQYALEVRISGISELKRES